MPRTFGGTAEKRKPSSGSWPSPVICSQIGMSAAEQLRMHGPRPNPRIVDIVAVDPDQRRAMFGQPFGRVRGQERMVLAVAISPPMTVPAGVHQHGLPARRPGRRTPPASTAMSLSHGCRTTTPGRSASEFERQVGKILAVGIAMERRVQIGAGVRDHVDPADLEGRAVLIVRGRPSRVQKSQICGPGSPG